jgi:hypothetical protein
MTEPSEISAFFCNLPYNNYQFGQGLASNSATVILSVELFSVNEQVLG